MAESAKGYVAGGNEYRYPRLGDEKPPGGAKVCLLTTGGVCIIGPWPSTDDHFFLGWAPLPKRNREREAVLQAQRP